MPAPSDRTPSAQGNLQETPFCHVLIYVYRRANNTGTLRVLAPQGEALVRIQLGRPIMASVPWRARYLFDALLPLCGVRAAPFEFYDDDRLSGHADAITGNVDPYALIAGSLEKYARQDAIDSVLQRFAGGPMRMPPNRELDRLRLDRRDMPFIELIRAAPATLDELITQSPLSKERSRGVLYALIVTQMLVPHDAQTENTVRTQSAPTITRDVPSTTRPTRRSSPAWRVLASLRPDLSARMDSGSLRPADITEAVKPPASVSTKPPGAAHSLRPDPSQGPKSTVTISTTPPGSAYSVRPDPSQGPKSTVTMSSSPPGSVHSLRPRSDSGPLRSTVTVGSKPPAAGYSLRPSGPAPGPSGAPASPAPEDIPGRIKRTEQLLQRQRHDEAIAEVDAMLQLEPQRAELHGLRAQALFEKHSSGTGMPRSVIDSLKRALEIDPDETRALFTRGLVCKRGGDLRKAANYFKRVLQIDPKHLEAQRELRLAKLRE